MEDGYRSAAHTIAEDIMDIARAEEGGKARWRRRCSAFVLAMGRTVRTRRRGRERGCHGRSQ